MNQGISASTTAVTCQRCGHAVRVWVRGVLGALQCHTCGERRAVGTQATGRSQTRIEVESGDDGVFGPNYGIQ